MKIFDIDLEQELASEEEEDSSFNLKDLESVKNNIHLYTKEKLCEMIVVTQYLHLDENISVICMEELSKRRELGDNFIFESYIDNLKKDLPVIDIPLIPDFSSILNKYKTQ